MFAEEIQCPRQQGGARVVPGDEHGQQLIADETVVHARSDQHAQQIFAAVVFLAPLLDDVVEIVIDGVQAQARHCQSGALVQNIHKPGEMCLSIFMIDGHNASMSGVKSTRNNVPTRMSSATRRISISMSRGLAVLPRRRDLIGVAAEQIDVGGKHLFVQRGLHRAAQLIVLGAVGDQHALAQTLRHWIGGDAPTKLLALFDQQEAIGLRAGEHDRVEAQQVEA